MIDTPAWGDFMGMVVKARDGLVADLVKGTPNLYKERGDNEKRAMIHALNVILEMPLDVERDAQRAAEAMRRYAEQTAR